MQSPFDPYEQWLGIPPVQQPPTLYHLLGAAPLESDGAKLRAAAAARLAALQPHLAGPKAAAASQLVKEIEAALARLLQPAQKSHYDAVLRAALNTAAPPVLPDPRPITPDPSLPNLPVATIVPITPDPAVDPAAERMPTRRERAAMTLPADLPRPAPTSPTKRGWPRWATYVLALAGAVAVVACLMWLRRDYPQLMPVAGVRVKIGETITFPARLVDAEAWQGKAQFRLGPDAPPGATIDPTTGRFAWRPTPEQAGQSYLVTIHTSRSANDTLGDSQQFEVIVHRNRPPEVEELAELVVDPGQLVDLKPRGRDTDLPPSRLTWSLAPGDKPRGLTLEPGTGRLAGRISLADVGRHFRIGVTAQEVDQQALATTRWFPLHVRNHLPLGYGIKAEFFKDDKFTDTRAERFDFRIDHWWCQQPPEQKVSAQAFAVRWSGWIRTPLPGEYEWIAISDDGLRVFIDDQPIINDFAAGPIRRRTAKVSLTAKSHAVRIEYVQRGGESLVTLRWRRPDKVEEIIPTACWLCVKSDEPAPANVLSPTTKPVPIAGLLGEYFHGMKFEQPVDKQIDPQVDFPWAEGKATAGDRLPADNFSVRWTGWLTPPVAGKYKLIVAADAGVRLWLDDKPLLDQWKPRTARRHEVAVDLTDQRHAVKLEYFEDQGPAVVSLRWIMPGETLEEAIPARHWSHDEGKR